MDTYNPNGGNNRPTIYVPSDHLYDNVAAFLGIYRQRWLISIERGDTERIFTRNF